MDAKDVEIARLRDELERAQHEIDEVLESTKDIEAQLEQDVAQVEKQLERARNKNEDLMQDVQEWKRRYQEVQKQHDQELSAMRKELEESKSACQLFRSQLREEELRHDDLERQERIVTVSYQDLETKYHQVLEKNADLESEVEEKKILDIECQRLRDDLRDINAELAILKVQETSRHHAIGEPAVQRHDQDSTSPNESPLPTKKQTYFVNPTVAVYDRPDLSKTHIERPPSRLATSNSVRNLQSLSMTITALREKMRAARNLPQVVPLSAPGASISQQGQMPDDSEQASHDEETFPRETDGNVKSMKDVRRQSGIPTPERSFGRGIKSPLIRQYVGLPRAQARQVLSVMTSGSPVPAKYSSLSGSRNTGRRRSVLLTAPNNAAQSRDKNERGLGNSTPVAQQSNLPATP